MKTQNYFPFIALLLCIGAGCAGYNSVLFTTKSNAGLDFDAKPPTAEITISRKESVIAPGFENGKTPPVMASFKPRTGFAASFENFGLGVDQTFAGGDAAVALAKYYDRKDTPTDNPDEYDSTLNLSKAPTGYFRKLSEPGKTRPFIFGTDTLLGLKIAWSGAAGQFPDSVKAGFNRKEFAWAPIGYTNGAPAGSIDVKTPSFLATIESGIKAGKTNRIDSLQYFATGEAATQLSRRPEVRAAMIQRLDPNARKLRFAANAKVLLGKTLSGLYDNLNTLAQPPNPDKQAANYLTSLDGIDFKLPAQWSSEGLIHFRWNTAVAPPELREDQNWPPAAIPYGQRFRSAIAFRSHLEESYAGLRAALGDSNARFLDSAGNPMPPATRTALPGQLEKLKARLEQLEEDIGTNRDVLAAYSYVRSLLTVE